MEKHEKKIVRDVLPLIFNILESVKYEENGFIRSLTVCGYVGQHRY